MLGELAQEAPAMQAHDGSSDALLQGVPARVEPVIDDVPLGVDNNDVDGTEPCPDDAVGGLCRDLVVHGSGTSAPRCTAPGDTVLAPWFLSAMALGESNYVCQVPPAHRPCLSTRGRWRTMWSRRVHGLQWRT
jgi:hypothetical protein